MSQNNEAQGIFRDSIVRANVEMLKLALTNLALAGVHVEVEVDDGWHKAELLHIGKQLIDGSVDELHFPEVYASETVEIAPPDYITEDLDPNFKKFEPTIPELMARGILAQPVPERASDLTSPTGSRPSAN